jgi:SAM-dependent methyltransferase
MTNALPSRKQLCRQAAWLSPARSRLLRQADIARRRSVLDLACGYGAVTDELAERCNGRVVALDCRKDALIKPIVGVHALCGDAEKLPFADGVFDLIFCQFALLWLDASAAVREIRRVLMPGGVLAAIEPDYGGLVEHPSSICTRELWLSALDRAGADPYIGRKLPGILEAEGFCIEVGLLDRLMPPDPLRFELLEGLPLTAAERDQLNRIKRSDAELDDSTRVAHLPMFLILAEAPP